MSDCLILIYLFVFLFVFIVKSAVLMLLIGWFINWLHHDYKLMDLLIYLLTLNLTYLLTNKTARNNDNKKYLNQSFIYTPPLFSLLSNPSSPTPPPQPLLTPLLNNSTISQATVPTTPSPHPSQSTNAPQQTSPAYSTPPPSQTGTYYHS